MDDILDNMNILNDVDDIPIYVRYVDDIFIVSTIDNMLKLKSKLEEASVLKFTCEIPVEDKIPFLDVYIQHSDNGFVTSVYHKPTDIGSCLNAKSDCPERYKVAVLCTVIT